MEVKEIRFTVGTRSATLRFYPDDTIETIRQLAALEAGSHPDRMFLMVKTEVDSEYYSANPKHWTELFFRMSYDGKKIPANVMATYVNQIRLNTGITNPREVTLEEWEAHEGDLNLLYEPDTSFYEWRIFGVPAERSFVMPVPPADIPMKPSQIPGLQVQTLFETLHDPDEATELRAIIIPDTASENVKRNYFPFFVDRRTPPTIQDTITPSRQRLEKLFKLKPTPHETQSIIRAKWYIPLVSTRFPSPRTRFEQIFYGMTVNPDTTPYVGYFTSKPRVVRGETETHKFEGIRHKFYVENPTTKEIDPQFKTWWKGWAMTTQPQRRMPTLLFYRGTSRTSFDRVAVTAKDITVDVRREKGSKKSLTDLRDEIAVWIESMDALIPFIDISDLMMPRWELADLSVIAGYRKAVDEFDMHRFPCLQNIFGYRNDQFRLLRADQPSQDISQEELQAFEIFSQEDAEQTPQYLAEQMGITENEARVLFAKIRERGEEFDYEKYFRSYPVIKFTNKEVVIRFATNLERTMKYVNLLRYVLTSNIQAVNAVCPRRMDVAAPEVSLVKQEITIAEASVDEDFLASLGFEEEEQQPVATTTTAAPTKPKDKTMKVKPKSIRTHNYFNNRLQQFDKKTFDKSVYPNKCDKPKQVVVLTEEDKERIQSEIEGGDQYIYNQATEDEKLPLEDPDGTAICPPYWCMKDEIPLREEQMEEDEEGNLTCPVCHGKVRTTDKLDVNEYPVIERKTAGRFTPYPNLMKKTKSGINGRNIPCCYPEPRKGQVLTQKEDATYILDPMTENVPAFRMVFLPPDVLKRMKIPSDYSDSIRKGRLLSGKADVFRVGLGRPSKTLPTLLGAKTRIPSPQEAPNNLKKCSFYRTWDKVDPVRTIQEAYEAGQLTQLQELEYVTTALLCEVILVDLRSMEVSCGFWSDTMTAKSRSIVVFLNGNGSLSLLTRVSRVREVTATKTEYTADLRKKPFVRETLPLLRDLHSKACSVGTPVLADAVTELRNRGLVDYYVILDPLKRVQAIMIPKTIILPMQPTNATPDRGMTTYDGYHEVDKSDLPTFAQVNAFFQTTIHPGYKNPRLLQDVDGNAVEVRISSGFHIPIRRTAAEEEAKPEEVVNTVMNPETPESLLIEDAPNPEDMKTAQFVTYSEEIFQFLLFSLSKDIQQGEWDELREALESRSKDLTKLVTKWFKKSSYVDRTQKPVEFINKIRTPCGQFETDEDSCKKSTLCGWHNDTCKIRVKATVDPENILARLVKAMYTNDKQRAVVLDGLATPFFSTILYLEMPHELIVTTV